jgi:hypothetical protein
MCREFDSSQSSRKPQCLVLRLFKTGLGVMNLAEVRLQEGESIENALRRFKRKVQTEDKFREKNLPPDKDGRAMQLQGSGHCA